MNESTDDPGNFTADERNRFTAALGSKAAQPCPRCGTLRFVLIDGYVNLPISKSVFPQPHYMDVVPCIAACCQNCGYVFLHAAAVLGTIPEDSK